MQLSQNGFHVDVNASSSFEIRANNVPIHNSKHSQTSKDQKQQQTVASKVIQKQSQKHRHKSRSEGSAMNVIYKQHFTTLSECRGYK